ncbi:MAG: phosphoribosylamine--glycine ligase [Thermodesulfovibrionales bacterium]|nr:phosphoribosylamine--glycine ligase [Thermodesulfovibrionales bacterium]
MKVLVVGSGGREHAIVWKLSQSNTVDRIFCAPGNAGISEIAECVDISVNDFDALINFVKHYWIDITIVGPEEPLAKGIVDVFEREGRKIVGPSKIAAQMESSKVFAKEFMKRHRIPTAEYKVFTSHTHAEEYIRMKGAPIVIKAEGLAAGKGVIVANDIDEALNGLKLIMKDKIFGDAGNRVVIEDCLKGEEASYMVFTDGNSILPMASSQDHKRVFDMDQGPNTGGMGAYSPAPVVTSEVEKLILDKIIKPTIFGLKSEKIKFKGILYAGLMIKDGLPNVLEFNCRLGDPETQPIMMRMNNDLLDISLAIADERLDKIIPAWQNNASVCVVLASAGYPGKYEKGKIIKGLDEVKKLKDTVVFHAGTAYVDNNLVTNGGRVLGVTALGENIKLAKEKAYKAIEKIHFEGMHYRKDIADRALNRK